jgi:hypothetical protein
MSTTTLSPECMKILKSVLERQGDSAALKPNTRAYLFTSHYDTAEMALRALLSGGLHGKHAQSCMMYYKVTGIVDTEDALLYILNLMWDPEHVDRVSRICTVVNTIADEVNEENHFINTDKFRNTVLPEITKAVVAVFDTEIFYCISNINRTVGLQEAHKSYTNLLAACQRIVPGYDLYTATLELVNNSHQMDLDTVTNIKRTIKRVCDTYCFEKEQASLLDGIVQYIQGNLTLDKLLAIVTVAKKDDRLIVESWDLEELCRHINLSADGFVVGHKLLSKLWDNNCRDGKGYREKLVAPVKRWLSRSLFAYLYDVSQDTNTIPDSEIVISSNAYSLKYRGVWGDDPPFVAVGKQIMSIALGLRTRRTIAEALKLGSLEKLCKTESKKYSVYLDYISNYRYNFAINCCPENFETSLVIRPSDPRADFKKFQHNVKIGQVTSLSHTMCANGAIRELRVHGRFAEHIQHLMPDGELLMPDDASFMCLDC